MRTTVDLPDDLLKRAKIAAVERGVTLRELLGAAIARELASGPLSREGERRVQFPILASSRPGSLELTTSDIARAEEEEDLRRHGLSG